MDNRFFDECLLYYGLDDFVKHKDTIKECFLSKDINEQYLYKLYVYSRPFIKETWKDYIWDFLQSDIQDFEFLNEYALYKRRNRGD